MMRWDETQAVVNDRNGVEVKKLTKKRKKEKKRKRAIGSEN